MRYLIAILTGLLILTVSFEACHAFTTVAQVKGLMGVK